MCSVKATTAAQAKRYIDALEFPDSAAGMRQYERQLEFAEESDPNARDALARRYCRGWAVASQEYRRDLKKIYEQLEEPRGWGGPKDRTAGREMGAGARRFIEKSPQDRQGCAGGSQKRRVENTHSAGTTINFNGDKRMDR